MGAGVTVVFDGECGMCAWVVARLRPGAPTVAVVALQQARARGLAVDESRASREMLWMDEAGTVRGGADAFALWLAAREDHLARWGRMMLSRPVLPCARAVYRFVARNRRRIPGPWHNSCPMP